MQSTPRPLLTHPGSVAANRDIRVVAAVPIITIDEAIGVIIQTIRTSFIGTRRIIRGAFLTSSSHFNLFRSATRPIRTVDVAVAVVIDSIRTLFERVFANGLAVGQHVFVGAFRTRPVFAIRVAVAVVVDSVAARFQRRFGQVRTVLYDLRGTVAFTRVVIAIDIPIAVVVDAIGTFFERVFGNRSAVLEDGGVFAISTGVVSAISVSVAVVVDPIAARLERILGSSVWFTDIERLAILVHTIDSPVTVVVDAVRTFGVGVLRVLALAIRCPLTIRILAIGLPVAIVVDTVGA